METRNNKILGASLSLVAFSFGFASQAYAQTCKVHPTCESLGYINTATQCKNGEMVKCPFDASKVFCRNVSVCGTIGDILLDNKTCIAVTDINNLASDRTPIGVVFDVDRKLAIALEQGSSLQWATSYKDIPELTNYTSSSAALGDYNGKSNTSIIIADGDSNGYDTPAADYAYNYVTTGTNKGDWYLPAGGELQLIYNNRTTLNNSLSTVGGTQIPDQHWSSSEYDKDDAWILHFSAGQWFLFNKYVRIYVRPVFSFNNVSCAPNTCSGYTLTECPENGKCSTCNVVNSDCSSDGTKYKLDSCESGYKISGSSCIKDCTADNCSGYTLSSCPNHGSCSSCTIKNSDCTTGKTKYKLNYCTDGFYEDGDSCRQDYSVENVSIYCARPPYYCSGTATCSCNNGTSTKLTFPASETGDSIDESYISSEFDYECEYYCN